MSHKATNWAFEQPQLFHDMKPAELVVLLAIADCHNPVNGCFPSQEYISSVTNISERSVRDQLLKLRERGLVNWEESREANRQGSNRYTLAFENGFQPANFAARELDLSGGKNEGFQAAKNDVFSRQNLPPNPVIVTVTPTVRACAREGGRDFSELWDKWTFGERPDNRDLPEKLFAKLDPFEQELAIDLAPTFIRLMAVRRRRALMITYLKARLFIELDGAPEFDRDGDFVITPTRPEWSAWLGDVRRQFGENGVASYVKLGRLVRKTRWPIGEGPAA